MLCAHCKISVNRDYKRIGILAGEFLKNNPILRLAFPLMAGIAFSYFLPINPLLYYVLFALSLLVMFIAMYNSRLWWLFGMATTVSIFVLGMLAEQSDRVELLPQWSGEKGHFEAVLLEVPHMGGRSTKVRAQVTRVGLDSVHGARRTGVVTVYCANSVEAEQLHIGEKIIFEGKVLPLRNLGNPAEFDMELYMYVNGITGTVYLPVDGWRSLGCSELSLSMYALRLRDRLLRMYEDLGFGKEEFAVLSALTLGEKRNLSDNVRDIYSAAGASHLLALSGLHLGIFYMIITILFPIRGVCRRLVIMREIIIVVLLWAFVFISGFPASVVRAAILFTLISLSHCLQRDNSSMNALAFAAVTMLVVVPRWLFDIGFQLSFAAVVAILLLQPSFSRIINVNAHGRAYGYVAGLLTVSIAAQIGTFPFIWYYFGAFPLYFIFTNLIAVPLSFVVMLLSLLLYVFIPFAFLQHQLAWLINFLIESLNIFLRFAASIPYASLELPYVGVIGVVVVSVAGWFLLTAMLCAKRKLMLLSLLLLTVTFFSLYFLKNRDEDPYIIFYNSRECPVAHVVYNRENSYLLTSYPEWDVELEYTVKPYCRRKDISFPKLLEEGFTNDKLHFKNGLLSIAERKIKILYDDCWLDETAITPVDCLYLCRGFKGGIRELLLVYPSRYIVIDATLYAGSRRRIARECAEQNVRCIDVTNGAVKFLCNKTGVRFENMRVR